MDMGGASTQLSFIPAANATIQPSDDFTVTIFNNSISLYTHSYLCYGTNVVSQRVDVRIATIGVYWCEILTICPIQATVISQQGFASTTLLHPCLPIGYTLNVSLASAYVCEQHLLILICISFSTLMSSDYCSSYITQPPPQTYTFIGNASDSECAALIAEMLKNDTAADLGINQVPVIVYSHYFHAVAPLQPPVRGNFFGFSGYYYTMSFLFPTMDPLNPSIDQLDASLAYLCALNYTQLEDEYPTVPVAFLVRYCSNGLYISYLLGLHCDDIGSLF